jgi:hypothetical protein
MIDAIRPYLAAIRIAAYAILIGFLFTSGCSYGKKVSANKLYQCETDLGVSKDANKANLETIKRLEEANRLYASESAEQAEKVAQAVKDAKRAQERAEKDLAKVKKDLDNAYAKNREWSNTAIPSDIKRLLDSAGKN